MGSSKTVCVIIKGTAYVRLGSIANKAHFQSENFVFYLNMLYLGFFLHCKHCYKLTKVIKHNFDILLSLHLLCLLYLLL